MPHRPPPFKPVCVTTILVAAGRWSWFVTVDEYRECLNHLIKILHETLQVEASKQILYHRTRARGLEDMPGMLPQIERHRYMVEFWQRAAKDIWTVFQVEIKELRDNG